MNLFLWYPKCSTCKKAYQELQNLGIPINARDIKENNPTKKEIRTMVAPKWSRTKKIF